MGAADIVPGVSGGTVAFITGIYEKLISAIASFDAVFVKDIFTLKWKKALERVHFRFIITLYLGVAIAIFCMASYMHYLMETYPVETWSAFFGLIAGSIIIVFKEVQKWTLIRVILVLLGAASGWFICGLIPTKTPDTFWFYSLCGVIAICAMILPGISGSFLLLVLGKYYEITGAVKTIFNSVKMALKFDFAGAWELVVSANIFWMLLAFQIGQLAGIVGFSRFLKWLLSRWHEATMCVLTGLMIGAMRRIWPWKHELLKHEIQSGDKTKVKVIEEAVVMPWDYANEFQCKVVNYVDGVLSSETINTIKGLNNSLQTAIVLAIAGFVFVMVLEFLARDKDSE